MGTAQNAWNGFARQIFTLGFVIAVAYGCPASSRKVPSPKPPRATTITSEELLSEDPVGVVRCKWTAHLVDVARGGRVMGKPEIIATVRMIKKEGGNEIRYHAMVEDLSLKSMILTSD